MATAARPPRGDIQAGHDRHGVIRQDAHHRGDVVEIRQVAVAALDRAEPVSGGRADRRIAAPVVALQQVDIGANAGEPARELGVRVAVAVRTAWRRNRRSTRSTGCCPSSWSRSRSRRFDQTLGVEGAQREGRVHATGDEGPIDRPALGPRAGDPTAAAGRRTRSRSGWGPPGSVHAHAGRWAAGGRGTGRASRRCRPSGPARRSPLTSRSAS